jgi:hypothetical protein
VDIKLPTQGGALFPQGPGRSCPHESGNRHPADLKHSAWLIAPGQARSPESYDGEIDERARHVRLSSETHRENGRGWSAALSH